MQCSHIIFFTLLQYELFKLVKLVSSRFRDLFPTPCPLRSALFLKILYFYYLVSFSFLLSSFTIFESQTQTYFHDVSPHLPNLLLCGQHFISIENVSFAPGRWNRCAFPYSSCQTQLKILNICLFYIKNKWKKTSKVRKKKS